jgi:membrane fusion protein, multidrug efflux system
MSFNQKVLAAVTVVVVALFGIGFVRQMGKYNERENQSKAAAAVEDAQLVNVAPVSMKTLESAVAITGTVRAVKDAAVVGKMPGRITKVNVALGQAVKAGEVLAQVDGYELSLRVKQADAQAQAARAGVEQAKIQAEQAERALQRAKALREKNNLSAVDFEGADTGAKLAAVGVQAAQAQLQLAESGLAMAQKAYDDTRMTAPFDGVVARKMAQVGSECGPGQVMFVVQDQSSLKLEGTVPASQLNQVAAGASVAITIDELPGVAIAGTLTSVAPTLDDGRRVFIEVTVPRVKGLLPNMFGTAEIAKGGEQAVLTVPARAVLSSVDGALVYVVKEGRASLKKPKLGARRGDDFVVEDGLSNGEQAVVSGDAGLKDGIKVTVVGG